MYRPNGFVAKEERINIFKQNSSDFVEQNVYNDVDWPPPPPPPTPTAPPASAAAPYPDMKRQMGELSWPPAHTQTLFHFDNKTKARQMIVCNHSKRTIFLYHFGGKVHCQAPDRMKSDTAYLAKASKQKNNCGSSFDRNRLE